MNEIVKRAVTLPLSVCYWVLYFICVREYKMDAFRKSYSPSEDRTL